MRKQSIKAVLIYIGLVVFCILAWYLCILGGIFVTR